MNYNHISTFENLIKGYVYTALKSFIISRMSKDFGANQALKG